MNQWYEYKKGELLKLPKRDWNKTSWYNGLLLVNTKQKHDSGYNNFAVIGERGLKPVEIVGYMDDLRLGHILKGCYVTIPAASLAIDCSMAGVFRIHINPPYKIYIGENISTTNWWVEKEEK